MIKLTITKSIRLGKNWNVVLFTVISHWRTNPKSEKGFTQLHDLFMKDIGRYLFFTKKNSHGNSLPPPPSPLPSPTCCFPWSFQKHKYLDFGPKSHFGITKNVWFVYKKIYWLWKILCMHAIISAFSDIVPKLWKLENFLFLPWHIFWIPHEWGEKAPAEEYHLFGHGRSDLSHEDRFPIPIIIPGILMLIWSQMISNWPWSSREGMKEV